MLKNLSRNVQQEQRERTKGRRCGVVSPSSPCPSKSHNSPVCDQTWPPASIRGNAVVRTEDPEFHPNSINSQNLPKTFPRNLHVKMVTFLNLSGLAQLCSVSPALGRDLRSDKSQKGWKRSKSSTGLEAQRAKMSQAVGPA